MPLPKVIDPSEQEFATGLRSDLVNVPGGVLFTADPLTGAATEVPKGHGVAADAVRVELPTDGNGKVGLNAGTAQIGSVIGRTAVATVTPTVTASAYTAGNVVGGKLTFSSMLDTALSGILQSIHVVSKTALTAGLKLYLFNADPSSSTFTDKSAPSIHASDFAKLIGVYPLSQPDSGLGTHAVWLLDSIGKLFNASGSTLYAVLITTGTPTPGSTSDFSVTMAVIKD